MTPLIVEATYENGVLKPIEPLPLKEHHKVRLTVEEVPASEACGTMNLTDWLSSIEAVTGLVDGPPDWAAQHDHYVFGAPKRNAPHGD